MIKSIFSISLLFTFFLSFAQDIPINENGMVEYSMVVEYKYLSDDELFSTIIEWAHSNKSLFNRSNQTKSGSTGNVLMGIDRSKDFHNVDALYDNDEPVALVDFKKNKMIINIVDRYTGSSVGCPRVIYTEYVMTIRTKDERFKYEINKFNYKHYNFVTSKQEQIYGKAEGPCGSYGTLEDLLKCNHCKKGLRKYYYYLDHSVKDVITDLEKYILESEKEDESW